jgi:hypothetical protein
MDIDSPPDTVKRTGRVSRHPCESWLVLTTNTDTPMSNFNNPVMDPDEEVLNTGQTLLEDGEPKLI